MILWIFAFVLLASLAIIALSIWWFSETSHEIGPAITITAGGVGAIVSGILILAYALALTGAPAKAKLLNDAYGTNYTTDDLIWGESIIKEVIQGKRGRLDLTVEQK